MTNDGDEGVDLKLMDIIKELPMEYSEATKIGQYLFNEGLIWHHHRSWLDRFLGSGEIDSEEKIGWNPDYEIRITHKGVVELELAMSKPEHPTEHFPQNSINFITYGTANIQQNSPYSRMQITNQSITISQQQLNELRQILADIIRLKKENTFANDEDDDLNKEIQIIQAETNSRKPKAERIKDALTTIKNVLEGAGAGTVIVARIAAWLNGLS